MLQTGMKLKLPDWITAVFSGFKIFCTNNPTVDLATITQTAAAEYVLKDGKVYFKLHFPEEGTRQDFKRAVLDHVDYCGPSIIAFGSHTTYGELGMALSWHAVQAMYNRGDAVTFGTATYEIIQIQQTPQAQADVPGDGQQTGV